MASNTVLDTPEWWDGAVAEAKAKEAAAMNRLQQRAAAYDAWLWGRPKCGRVSSKGNACWRYAEWEAWPDEQPAGHIHACAKHLLRLLGEHVYRLLPIRAEGAHPLPPEAREDAHPEAE